MRAPLCFATAAATAPFGRTCVSSSRIAHTAASTGCATIGPPRRHAGFFANSDTMLHGELGAAETREVPSPRQERLAATLLRF
eukprot:SAG11_NODE_19403_length_467_cov_1.043478_1_plen_82_part_01